ncbi:MAG: NIPSNAP family protein [Reyranella sp.]|nr:NIPSNAP family protein [Reyranella sp.]MBL6651758.1 NIPSNAP family protein [Reyranella sp.]
MIVEVRTYTVKPGKRSAFIEFFENRAVPAMRATGMAIFGPLLDQEKPDVFHWLRLFASPEERDRLRSAFYEGPAWKGELEAIAMPMLAKFEASITTVSGGFVGFDGSKGLHFPPPNSGR